MEGKGIYLVVERNKAEWVADVHDLDVVIGPQFIPRGPRYFG